MGQTSFLGRANAFDLALAGFAAAAFGFAAFAMPEWRLNQLVLGTGLAEAFPPARPPLGLKATLGIAALAATFAFLASLVLLTWAGRVKPRTRGVTEADAPPEPIRLRRADAHPDAPQRRPLVAGRDLGEPPADELVLGAEALEQHPENVPSFLVRQEPETVEMEPVAADEEEDELEPLMWDPELARGNREEAPEPEAEIQPEPEPESEPEPEPELEPEPAAEREPEPGPVAAAVAEPQPRAPAGAGLIQALASGPAPEASISTLMQRLETGLSRKERAAPLDPAAVAPPADAAVGHRLRNAINDLQKLAARN